MTYCTHSDLRINIKTLYIRWPEKKATHKFDSVHCSIESTLTHTSVLFIDEISNLTNLKFLKLAKLLMNFKTVNFKIHTTQIITFVPAKFQQTHYRKHST